MSARFIAVLAFLFFVIVGAGVFACGGGEEEEGEEGDDDVENASKCEQFCAMMDECDSCTAGDGCPGDGMPDDRDWALCWVNCVYSDNCTGVETCLDDCRDVYGGN